MKKRMISVNSFDEAILKHKHTLFSLAKAEANLRKDCICGCIPELSRPCFCCIVKQIDQELNGAWDEVFGPLPVKLQQNGNDVIFPEKSKL